MRAMTAASFVSVAVVVLHLIDPTQAAAARSTTRWSVERAQDWFRQQPWRKGANFLPSTASSQLEMFQPETWDEATITRELGWAKDFGYNLVRVFLHDLLWQSEGSQFLDRVDRFLGIADAQGIGTMLVLFDGCWDPFPHLGPQLQPRPRVHNSRWVQSPGAEALTNLDKHVTRLESYVTAVVGRFANDSRVVMWDLFNEPDNANVHNYGYDGARVPVAADAKGTELRPFEKAVGARALLEKTVAWARQLNPSQPLTVPVFTDDPTGDLAADALKRDTYNWTLQAVDVVTFHNYNPVAGVAIDIKQLRGRVGGRPLVCSEYMARTTGSTFDPVLGFLQQHLVWAVNWGWVSGKSQTIFPWDSWNKNYPAEPKLWHHDVLRSSGKLYLAIEGAYIKNHTETFSHL